MFISQDAKRLESGIQFQNEAEIAGHLLECENLLRQQVVKNVLSVYKLCHCVTYQNHRGLLSMLSCRGIPHR